MSPVDSHDPADLIPSTVRDRVELVDELRGLRSAITHTGLRRVVDTVLGAPGFLRRFAESPGSQSRHHAHVGGLLEHTVAVATLARFLGERYERVDADLLLAAAILHDVGKVEEIECATSIEYSDAGRFLGHVVLGERIVADALSEVGDDVPSDLGYRLRHVVLSHHGELEWGAPKRPCVLEAIILHHADNMDAKVAGFIDVVAGAGAVDERWSDVTNLFRRPLYVPAAADDDRWAEPVEDDGYAAASA
jgi:3'-5' exoribonuclease